MKCMDAVERISRRKLISLCRPFFLWRIFCLCLPSPPHAKHLGAQSENPIVVTFRLSHHYADTMKYNRVNEWVESVGWIKQFLFWRHWVTDCNGKHIWNIVYSHWKTWKCFSDERQHFVITMVTDLNIFLEFSESIIFSWHYYHTANFANLFLSDKPLHRKPSSRCKF